MAAKRRDIYIEQGATFTRTFTWATKPVTVDDDPVPIDLTGCTARMHLRESIDDLEPALVLDTDEGIVLGGVEGTIKIRIEADTTALLAAALYVYDLEVVFPAGDIFRVISGKVKVSPEVTR